MYDYVVLICLFREIEIIIIIKRFIFLILGYEYLKIRIFRLYFIRKYEF